MFGNSAEAVGRAEELLEELDSLMGIPEVDEMVYKRFYL
jgi:hypothetical protein